MSEQQKRRVISSSLGTMPLNERRSVVIDDPTEESELEEIDYREVQRLKEEQKKSKASSAAVSKLELLLGLSRKIVEIDVDGNVFVLRTLKNKEKQNILLEAAKKETVILQSLTVKDLTIAYSLFKINNELIENIIGNDFNNKLEFVQEMDSNLHELLWSEYLKLNKDENPEVLGTNPNEVRDTLKK